MTEWLTLALLIVTGVGIPLILFFMSRAATERKTKFDELHGRLNHLDDCLDLVQKVVLSKAATREDMMTLKAEVTEIINRQRTAISTEISGVNMRLQRLEDPYFGKRDG